MNEIIAAITADSAESLKTALKIFHLGGLVLGLGAATLLDLIILRFAISRRLSVEHSKIIRFSASVVTVGLAFLWLSGIGYLLHYNYFDPTKLSNPKVWAKITIVAVLTANGVFIHTAVLPLVKSQVGKTLFSGVARKRRTLLMLAGVISAVSWYIPLILGATALFNFVVPYGAIVTAYAVVLLASTTVVASISWFVLRDPSTEVVWAPGWPGKAAPGALGAIACAIAAAILLVQQASLGGQTSRVANTPLDPHISAIANYTPTSQHSSFQPEQPPSKPAVTQVRNDTVVVETKIAESSVADSSVTKSSIEESKVEQPQVARSDEIRGPDPEVDFDPTFVIPANVETAREPAKEAKSAGYVGFWAVNRVACANPSNRRFIRVAINAKGARAGGTYCAFTKVSQTGSRWTSQARCSSGTERWTSNVKLLVKNNRLFWESERGSQVLFQCPSPARQTQIALR